MGMRLVLNFPTLALFRKSQKQLNKTSVFMLKSSENLLLFLSGLSIYWLCSAVVSMEVQSMPASASPLTGATAGANLLTISIPRLPPLWNGDNTVVRIKCTMQNASNSTWKYHIFNSSNYYFDSYMAFVDDFLKRSESTDLCSVHRSSSHSCFPNCILLLWLPLLFSWKPEM